jgi:hypothetical protein
MELLKIFQVLLWTAQKQTFTRNLQLFRRTIMFNYIKFVRFQLEWNLPSSEILPHVGLQIFRRFWKLSFQGIKKFSLLTFLSFSRFEPLFNTTPTSVFISHRACLTRLTRRWRQHSCAKRWYNSTNTVILITMYVCMLRSGPGFVRRLRRDLKSLVLILKTKCDTA